VAKNTDYCNFAKSWPIFRTKTEQISTLFVKISLCMSELQQAKVMSVIETQV